MILLNWFKPKKYLCEIEFTYQVKPLYNRDYTFTCFAYCSEDPKTEDLIKLFRPFSVLVGNCKITNIVAEKIPTI